MTPTNMHFKQIRFFLQIKLNFENKNILIFKIAKKLIYKQIRTFKAVVHLNRKAF